MMEPLNGEVIALIGRPLQRSGLELGSFNGEI